MIVNNSHLCQGISPVEETGRGIEMGGEAYLQTPVEPESLFLIFEEILP